MVSIGLAFALGRLFAAVQPTPTGADSARAVRGACLRCLTFELRGRQRQDASARLAKMYRVPPAGRWWPAVGAPFERGVRRQLAALTLEWTTARCN